MSLCKSLFFLSTEPNDQHSCMTTSGASPNSPCIFPFIYNGYEHTNCLFVKGQEWEPWCSTLVDSAGEHIGGQGNWGNCGPGCPMPSCKEGTYGYPCENTHGDCDNDSECKDELICGTDNCATAWNFPTSADCCTSQDSKSLHWPKKKGNIHPDEPFQKDRYLKKHFLQSKRRYSRLKFRKSSVKKSSGPTVLKNSHLASSKYGLIVVLNPNEDEYTDAVKNNYVGFKTLVHTPYNFAEVDAVGMAMDKNVQVSVGIRGHHAWITDAANALGLYQKKCLSRIDDMKKYKEVKLEVFANYTKKGCILECHANIFFEKCGCLPYHYPDFSVVWKKNTTCNHKGLQCISKLVGKIFLCTLDINCSI